MIDLEGLSSMDKEAVRAALSNVAQSILLLGRVVDETVGWGRGEFEELGALDEAVLDELSVLLGREVRA